MSRYWQLAKNLYHHVQAQWWRMLYRWPDRQLHLYGVTGSNGKTTTSIVLATILREAHGKARVGLISTDYFWFGETEKPNTTHMTSIDAKVVSRYLRRMVNQGVTYVVLELTSHALDQHRLAGLRLGGAIVLNVTHEHLDYHGTMVEYAAAKQQIINYLAPGAPFIGNEDDKYVREMINDAGRRGYAVHSFTKDQARSVQTELPGDFNQENVLAATLLARAIGVMDDTIVRAVMSVTGVPGRVEWIELGGGARAVVDFALTPDALGRLYTYLREETPGQLIGVFGAAGRRDQAKRPLITKIVSDFADEIVLTQDEPYDDPEEEIYQQLEAGLVDVTIPWQRIEDRTQAIRYAMAKVTAGDVVAVTGMGNYDTRVIGDEHVPWSDREVILKLKKELFGDTE